MEPHKKYAPNIELQTGVLQPNSKDMNAIVSVDYLDSALDEDDAEDGASYNYSTSSSNQPSEKDSKYYKQTYRRAWEKMPDFKGWLTGIDSEPLRAYCIYCQKSLHAHRLSLLKHTCTIRHQKAAELHKFQKIKSKVTNYVNAKPRKEVIEDIDEPDADMIEEAEVEEEEEEEEEAYDTLEEVDDAYSEEIIPTEEQETLEVSFEGNPEEIYEEEVKFNNYNRVTRTIAMSSLTENAIDKTATTDIMNNSNPSIVTVVTTARKPPISTHVLDTSRGQPVSGLQVSLYRLINGRWTYINEGLTNADGRCSRLLEKTEFLPGRYKLHFDVDKYFEAQKVTSLYPFIEIVFDCKENADNINYHIPLLLNPFGYTTYRGS